MSEQVVKIFTRDETTAQALKNILDDALFSQINPHNLHAAISACVSHIDGIVVESTEGPEDETTTTV